MIAFIQDCDNVSKEIISSFHFQFFPECYLVTQHFHITYNCGHEIIIRFKILVWVRFTTSKAVFDIIQKHRMRIRTLRKLATIKNISKLGGVR